MRHKTSYILLLISFFCTLNASASCLGDFFLTNQKTTIDKKTRVQYAKLIFEQVSALDDSIPELSPAENEWLNKEFASGAKRYNLAFDSVEHQKRMGKSFTKRFRSTLNKIINEKPLPVKQEVLYWASIATDIIDYYYPRVIKDLIKMKVVNGRLGSHQRNLL